MANVWKIGSRWSEYGSRKSSIISIFRRNSVVFIGSSDSEKFYREVKEGDYVAIADGEWIPSVARVVSNPFPLNDIKDNLRLRSEEKKVFNPADDFSGCYCARVKIVDLPEDSRFTYKWGAFFSANSIHEKVIELYEENLTKHFDIKAKTYRIMSCGASQDGKESIINGKTCYNVPVYQREYQWSDAQIERFMHDIFAGFWGSSEQKSILKEPLFIGTMQLSYEKYISKKECEQDIIDGQQRLTTIICILKYLQLKYPGNTLLQSIALDWFETKVNNGKEEQYLEEMLELTSLDDMSKASSENRYISNLGIIQNVIEENTTNDDGSANPLFDSNIDEFVHYFLNDIYFVVVETTAGLSKTIQIFNTINTAGLDLCGDDIFKVRLYEYLHDIKGKDENTFKEIGDLYKEVKDINSEWRKKHGEDIVSIEEVRSIYKKYLISEYDLPASLYSMGTDSFFEKLFDVLLNVQEHAEFKSAITNKLELSLCELGKIIKVAQLWNESDYRTCKELIDYKLIEKSRYSSYSDIAYQILLRNENLPQAERLDQVYAVLAGLSKVFFTWSLLYARKVYEIQAFMNSLYKELAKSSTNLSELCSVIREKVVKEVDNQDFRQNHLGKAIADNRIQKNLVCLVSDYFDEVQAGTSLEDLKDKLNTIWADIEHIHATANEDECTDIDYESQNCIGNLMMLEYDINRSIGKLPFAEKKLRYIESKFATARKISGKEVWGEREIAERKKQEISKISAWLFE